MSTSARYTKLRGVADGFEQVIHVSNDNIYPSTCALVERNRNAPTLQPGTHHNTVSLPHPVLDTDNMAYVNATVESIACRLGDRNSIDFDERFLDRWFRLPALGGNSIMITERHPDNPSMETRELRPKALSLEIYVVAAFVHGPGHPLQPWQRSLGPLTIGDPQGPGGDLPWDPLVILWALPWDPLVNLQGHPALLCVSPPCGNTACYAWT